MSQSNTPILFDLLLGPTVLAIISWIFDFYSNKKSRIILHFLPFLTFFFFFYSDPLFSSSFNFYLLYLIILFYNFFYYILTSILLWRVFFKQPNISIFNKIVVGIIFAILIGLFSFFNLIHSPLIVIEKSNIIFLGLIQKIELILFFLLFNFVDRSKIPVFKKVIDLSMKKETEAIVLNDILPYPKSSNADSRLLSFWEKNSAIYLSQEFNLDKLCKHLKIEKSIVVRMLYDTYQLSFNDILNRYRIYHFVLIYKYNHPRKSKIDAIIQDCGYANRSTFYLAFKKISTLTPSEFVSRVQLIDYKNTNIANLNDSFDTRKVFLTEKNKVPTADFNSDGKYLIESVISSN